MIKELTRKYYLEQGHNCAEAMLLAANEAYSLGLGAQDVALLSGFGGGMGCGSTCGALAGAVAVLSLLYPTTKNHKEDGRKESCAALVDAFEKKLGSTLCTELAAKNKTEEQRCFATVQLAAEVLDAQLAALNGEAAPAATTVSAEDIKRVKAWGFLHCKGTDHFNCRVITRNGIISNAESRCITEAANKFGNGRIALTTRLTMELQQVPYFNIEPLRAYLATAGLQTGGTGSKVRPVVACKGTTCQYGLYDTDTLSREIHDKFFDGYANVKLPHKFKIALGGCPNNCVKRDLNDFGIIGQKVPGFDAARCKGCKVCAIEKSCPIGAAKLANGKLSIDQNACNHCGRCVGKCPFQAIEGSTYGYKVCIGGRWGKKVAHGQDLNRIFTTKEEVLAVLEKAILLFREQGITGERFADTIARLGFEAVQTQLLGSELLARKEAILGAELHLVGGATC